MNTLASYEGGTEAGRMEGEGIYKYEDGTKYVGKFKNGAFHGEGLCGNQSTPNAIDAIGSQLTGRLPHRRGQAHLRERGI